MNRDRPTCFSIVFIFSRRIEVDLIYSKQGYENGKRTWTQKQGHIMLIKQWKLENLHKDMIYFIWIMNYFNVHILFVYILKLWERTCEHLEIFFFLNRRFIDLVVQAPGKLVASTTENLKYEIPFLILFILLLD